MTRRGTILLLFTLSGVSALLYQIVWIRLLSHLLGGTSFAIAGVLAAFMAGLAAGSRFFGARSDRSDRPLRDYAVLEGGIALLGALTPLWIRLLTPGYVTAIQSAPDALDSLIRIAVAAVVVFPPTFLMGGTLPVLSRYFVHDPRRIGRGLGLLYALNTLGAVAGAFLAGFVLVEAVGLAGTIALAALGNALIAFGSLVVDRAVSRTARESARAVESPAGPPPGDARARPPAPELGASTLAVVFALSGFAALGFEVHWTRALHHFLGNSTYAYSAMLSTFLLGLSAGGWLGGQWADRARSPARALAWVLTGSGVAVLLTVPAIWGVLPRWSGDAFLTPSDVGWHEFVLRRFVVAFAVMIVPTTLLGATFPLVNRIGIASVSRLGRSVGFFYFANTVGAIAGSLAAGFVLLPLLGPKIALVATAYLSTALGVVVFARTPSAPRRDAAIAAGVLGVCLVAFPVWQGAGRTLLADTQTPGDRVLFDAEDPIASTRVYEKPGGERDVAVDGHRIGGTALPLLRKQKVLAHLPLVLVPEARSALAVGLGSGVTLGTLAMYDELEQITCAEIVPAVAEAAELFAEWNGNVLRDPRVVVEVTDGIQLLLTTTDRFDVISSDSKINPHYVGNAPLLSRDYYDLCRERLTERGVMVQWLPLHLPASEIQTIVRSFGDAFPHSAIFWHYPFNIVQAGSRAPIVIDMDRARRFAESDALRSEYEFLQLNQPAALASTWIAGGERLQEIAGDGPRNTWMRPRLEFTILREHLRKATALHEDDNLRWLLRARDQSPPVSGAYDADELRRFLVSSGRLLAGYAAGGGIGYLDTGRSHFVEGLRDNPDDWRLRRIVEVLDQGRADRAAGSLGTATP